ncbi:hypothetical protein [Legionella bononiensis]|uniref:Ubiquitin-like protease family profile domain-containing protein n=1 Tax=Legionella bononiensis TaxID=2793102 RepID=A0ABS1WAM5_9GAMM|nr:hypothetical protein [Legionella bononiensis]MBL7480384.1 hypothetical protein [Legionella bononiensis]MBL7526384.1 hypothetical protein [Legionella bononiensis]MBL7563122.1 hypothetical protein [Legionella bononiensis]
MPWIYPPFTSLDQHEQQAVIRNYERKFRDFDNDIIIYSALEVLRANGHTNVNAIKVGPDRAGDEFNLYMQLIGKIPQDKRYTIFSLPTLQGSHSVAVVIDTQNREVHVIDSLNQVYPEATGQIQTAIDEEILDGYRIVRPASPVTQQSDGWSCGIHSAANIVGIITGDIDLKTNKGLGPRSNAEVQNLLGIFSKAYGESSVQRQNNLNNPRLNVRQKRTLRYGLQGLDTSTLNPQIQNDIRTLIDALLVEFPQGMTEAELMQQRSFKDFAQEFTQSNPGNVLNSLLSTPEFIAILPANLEENAEEKEVVITLYLSEQLHNLQNAPAVASSSTPVVASSSAPVVAGLLTLDAALTRFADPITDGGRRGDVRHAISYFAQMTQHNSNLFNEVSCQHIANHTDPTNLACALIMLGSTDDPKLQEIVALPYPMDYFFSNPSASSDTAQPAQSSSVPVISSSSQPSASPAPQAPSVDSSSSSAPDERLTLELKQFISTLRSERGGLDSTAYWLTRTEEQRADLMRRFDAANQTPAIRPASGFAGGFFGSSSQPARRSELDDFQEELEEFLQEKVRLMGFDTIESARQTFGDEVFADMTEEFFTAKTSQLQRR